MKIEKTVAMERVEECAETLNLERPALHFNSPLDDREHSISFGYWANEPTAALFKGNELLALIPREVLQIAVEEGWAE